MRRRLWIAFLFLTVGLLTISASCPEVKDCKTTGCPEGRECREVIGGVSVCVSTGATPTPSPSPTASPTPTPSPTPSPTPTATPVPGSTPTPTPTPVPGPSPTPTPCVPKLERVCVMDPEGLDVRPFDRNKCWTCKDWLAYMMRDRWDDACACIKPGSAQYTPGDPAEDGDVGGHPGYWLHHDKQVSKTDCTTKQGKLAVDFPRAEERIVPCPSPTPPPSPTPTPGCPALVKVGGMFLSAVDCGNCRKQGYLGVRVNVTSTELCREGDAGCVCDPARNRCEMPRACQNPLGASVYLTLPGKFADDLCDANSDNPFNCHHKPKADEAGITEFKYCPHGASPSDPRCTAKCIDVREVGTREVACR